MPYVYPPKLQNKRFLSALQIPPDGGEAAQVSDNIFDGGDDVFHIFRRVFPAQSQPQGSMGHIMDPADGQQHMAGIQGTGGAGTAGGSADALLIQQEKKGFSLNAFKAEADISGEPLFGVAVQGGMGDFRKACNQPVPENRSDPSVLNGATAPVQTALKLPLSCIWHILHTDNWHLCCA